jgi:hypothetical protein
MWLSAQIRGTGLGRRGVHSDKGHKVLSVSVMATPALLTHACGPTATGCKLPRSDNPLKGLEDECKSF